MKHAPSCCVAGILLPLSGALPAPVLLRDALDTEATYANAVNKLKTGKILSEFYFIAGLFAS